ncbi:MAG: GtrA family protein [Myxococcota bacterium]
MSSLTAWLQGDLTSGGRIWAAVGPAVVLLLIVLLSFVAYCIRCAVYGRYRDAEIEARGSSVLLGRDARAFFAWMMNPIWTLLFRLQVPPNAITTLSLLLASAAGVSVAFGRFSLAGWLYLSAGACDFVDGRLARSSGRATAAGAALDSILDRYAESVVLIGLAWFYRDTWVLIAVLATLVGSMMVSYVRARGEGLGVDVKVGLMQRPERVVLLGVSMAFAPIVEVLVVPNEPHSIHRLVAFALIIMAASSNFTALRRLYHVFRALTPESERPPPWFGLGRASLGRTAIAAAIATGLDFVVFVALVSGDFGLSASVSTAVGCIVGGITNYAINRVWTFGSRNTHLHEAPRYALVSSSSALLNSGGVAVMLLVPGLDYRLAWFLVRGAVFVGWNYPLQRDFVFTTSTVDDPKLEAA